MSTKTTAVIADDHPVVLAGLAPYMARQGIDVIAIADSVNGLLSELKKHALLLPDIVITGYDYGGEIDGLRLIERLHRMYPKVKIVVFSGQRPHGLVRQLLAKGADAFVAKSMALQFVADACQTVLSGAKYIDPDTEGLLIAPTRHCEDKCDDRLSPREREVLRLLAQGYPLQEIARKFQRSVKTISVQKCSAMSKLGLRNEIELALYLVKHRHAVIPS
ncbi:two componenttranscriptional regulator LuxR family [Cupriavidus necator N-1]|uniref:Two componenttranscriptional regulator LuxR family n=1 Tax=Cupriavidus necator (strain ATCC 43291 / DSM 13513 / CCUG 52238 / LMG 8453 / N-1) TaxID=1042878 RepID=G0EVP9_CUPNN|nr:two componenttranscriptional regulator LuxR family [Cupriavidus necator N-1]